MKIKNLEIKFKFLWYDFWIGGFYDRHKKVFYFCPVPMCVFIFEKQETKNENT